MTRRIGFGLALAGAAALTAILLGDAAAFRAAAEAGCLPCIARDALNNLLTGGGVVASSVLAAGMALGTGALGAGRTMGNAALGAGSALGNAALGAGRAQAQGAAAATAAADAVGDAMADALGLNDPPTYTPGDSPLPQPGQTYDFPGMGPATVQSVEHHSGSTSSLLGEPAHDRTTIVTDRGTLRYGSVGGTEWGTITW